MMLGKTEKAVKQVCFDVIGTCFHFDTPIQALEEHLSTALREQNTTAEALFFSLFYAAQRDFTYLSMVGSYTPIGRVIKETVKRACLTLGVDSGKLDVVGDAVLEAFKRMPARPGLKTLFDGLKEDGWDCVAVTNGAMATSVKYFKDADIELEEGNCLSCDDLRIAKPAAEVYENANRYLDARMTGNDKGTRWFVAAHSWDLIAARKAGFKTAYLSVEEHDPCTSLFGEFDLYADSPEELLKKMRAL